MPVNLKNFINVAVIGVGAFGRNHARVYQQLAQQGEAVRLVGVVDADLARADVVAREFGCRGFGSRSEEHTSELQSHSDLVCRLLLEKKKKKKQASHVCICERQSRSLSDRV